MFNRLNGMGMPPVNNDNNQQPAADQAQRPMMFSHVIFIPIDQRSVEQIWQSVANHESSGNYLFAYRDILDLVGRGDPEALYRAGMYNFLALGIPESFNKAYGAFTRAARAGHPEAQKMLETLSQYQILRHIS